MSDMPAVAWAETIASDRGPDNYTMRLTLLALAVMMMARRTCVLRATGDDLATATGLSRNWAMKMTLKAVQDGWLTRARAKGWRQGWQAFTYEPRLPDGQQHDATAPFLGKGALRDPLCSCGRVKVDEQSWCSVCKNAYQAKWRLTHPLEGEARVKANARSYANVYQRRGKLRKERCFNCGDERTEKHHEDYSQPLQVAWLCRKCHVDHHKGIRTVPCETKGVRKHHGFAAALGRAE